VQRFHSRARAARCGLRAGLICSVTSPAALLQCTKVVAR
jgi:hypothetical protein